MRSTGSQTETLCGIFREYIQGTSLKAKAEELSEDKIEYAPGKYTWNKNRVQRILTDQRYLGTDQYPPIIEESTFQEVQQIMAERNTQKGCNRQEVFSSSVIPILCGKCGHPVIRRYDARWKNTTKHYCTNPTAKRSTASQTKNCGIKQVNSFRSCQPKHRSHPMSLRLIYAG